MEFIITGLLIAIIGTISTYYILNSSLQKKYDNKLDELDQKKEIALEKAELEAQRIVDEAESKADKIVSKAEYKNENIKRDKIQEAKEKYASLKSNFEEETAEKKLELRERLSFIEDEQNKIDEKKKKLNSDKLELEQLHSELKAEQSNIEKQRKALKKKQKEVSKLNEKRIEKLENLAGISEKDARNELFDAVKAKAETDAMAIKKEIIDEANNIAKKKAKKIVIQSIQRMCAEVTIENTVTVFNLESDDVKGQIIGREGRNIRSIEAATGAEIVVDDTPEAIVISSFDPIRREICRMSLKRLVADGRIHPARIEEVVTKVRKELDEQIVELGERTVIELDIHGLKPYLIKMVGRMRFRSSYGQNLLKHSIETAHLCSIMASELGLSPKEAQLAKRAGLLHDIGKVSEEDLELSHALISKKLTEKYDEDPIVVNAVGAHHDEIEMNNIISPIVQACDAISGARPGARREIMESYMKRIGELENLAMGYDGVKKAYAMQAGRELRVIVESATVDDQRADDIAFMISEKIQDQLTYPGQINVTVIREKRSQSVAR